MMKLEHLVNTRWSQIGHTYDEKSLWQMTVLADFDFWYTITIMGYPKSIAVEVRVAGWETGIR